MGLRMCSMAVPLSVYKAQGLAAKKHNNNNKEFDETGRKLSHPELAEAEFG